MAKFNEILAPRYNRALSKLLGIKGPGPSPTISSDLMPVFPMEDSESVELRYIHSWNRYGRKITQAALGAGNTAGFILRNPTKNIMVVVENLVIQNPDGADRLQVSMGAYPAQTDLSNLVTIQPLDGRQQGNSSCVMSTGIYNAAFPGLPVLGGQHPASGNVQVIWDDNQELALTPGWGMQITDTTANQGLTVMICWRERALEDSELSF